MWPFTRNATYNQVSALSKLVMQIQLKLDRLGGTMADVSAMLNDLAADLDELGTPLDALLAENARLAAENAELTGEDVRESEAANAVRDAFNRVADRFQSEPTVPDVTPLPEAPAEDAGAGDVVNETDEPRVI